MLASSRAVYGEGAWRDPTEGRAPGQRSHAMLAAGEWDFPGLSPTARRGGAGSSRGRAACTAATKLAQEHVPRAWCLAVGVRPVVLRLQNVYGAGQSPTNPYTGIVPLFGRLAAAGEVIPVYEDGRIVRDFVFVDDVARALESAVCDLDAEPAVALDVGSGVPVTILEVARLVADRYGAPAPRSPDSSGTGTSGMRVPTRPTHTGSSAGGRGRARCRSGRAVLLAGRPA